MDERERKAHRIFMAALDLDGAPRAAFVAAECGDDDELLTAVESLLEAVGESTEFLESPVLAPPEDRRPEREFAADAIEGFRIIRRLGSGGMAEVFEAEQDAPRRRVAIKILHGALAGTSVLQRFRFEADVLARLNHPGIAQIHGSGTCTDPFGQRVPYFVLEYIPDATTIHEYVKGHQLPLRERLSVFASVCDAVQYGHQAGVIHRDLKPGNILVDGEGNSRIIDFGVATAIGPNVDRMTISQDRGHLVGTLNYMSPEQCSGDGRVDTRCDVYSLGVVLYELVTDVRPYDLSSSSILDAVQTVQKEAPVHPKERAAGVSKELNAIVMKALEKDPDRRYATASEFAADVRRFLDDRPVLARPATAAYQLQMFAKRNRALVAALSGTVVALLLGIIATTRMTYIAEAARDAAVENERVLKQVTEFQESQLRGIDVSEMGEGLRIALVDAVRSSLLNDPELAADPSQVEAMLADYKQLTQRANFTTLALDALDKNILQSSYDSIMEQFQEQPNVRAQLLFALASTMNQLGRPEPSVRVLEEALRTRRKHLGEDHPDTLRTLHAVGVLLSSLGEREPAIVHLREVLERQKRLLGPDHEVTLDVANSLGGALRLSGDHAAAERVWRDTLERRRRVLGEDHKSTLNSLNNLGVVLAVQGEYSQAEAAWRELLERRRRLLGENHPEYRASLSNLGMLLLEQGKAAEARKLLEQSLDSLRAELGDDHPSTLLTMSNVADVRKELGDLAGAEQLLRENLESRRRTLGPDHPDTLRALVNLGEFDHEMGRVGDAEHEIRQAIETQQRILGRDHPDTIQAVSVLARCLHEQERLAESEPLHLEAIESAHRAFGKEHALAGECLGHYGEMLIAARRWDEAESRLLEAHRILVGSQGATSRSSREVAGSLVALYEALEQAGEPRDDLDLPSWRRAAEPPR